jgi:hypothetical protein
VNRPLVNNQENRAELNVTLIVPGQPPANGSTMVIPDPIGLCANPVINNQQVDPKPPPNGGTKEHYVVATIWMTGDEVKRLRYLYPELHFIFSYNSGREAKSASVCWHTPAYFCGRKKSI